MQDRTFAVIGGDRRSAYAALALAGAGKRVRAAGLERAALLDAAHCCPVAEALEADYILLPLPLLDRAGRLNAPFSHSAPDVRALLEGARPDALLLAGRVTPGVAAAAESLGRTLVDYAAREDFERLNALPTAEGALAILLDRLPGTVAGASLLVTGFGRTAQSAALLFRAAGAEVCVCARSPAALAHARTLGMRTMPLRELAARPQTRFDAAVNTVPAPVLTAAALARLRPDCFVLDLASDPGGTDFEFAKTIGLRAELAPALPGRTAPRAAGGIIADTVLAVIEERRQRV